MTTALGVFHRGHAVGMVSTNDAGQFLFTYDRTWLDRPARFAISQSLPLAVHAHAGAAAHAFFANLLPEGRVRSMVARRLGISEDNDFALLAALGGECAGALVIAPDAPNPEEHRYRPLKDDEIARFAEEGGVFAEASATAGVRLSLAGAQDKLPVRVDGDRLLLPLGSSPSSHIVKFASRDYKHLPANEAFVEAIARSSGLPTVPSELRPIGEERHLLVARYDRVVGADGRITRLHQEDLCQALGVRPGRKYEDEGGPSFARCFQLVADCSSEPAPDVQSLVRWVAFNAIVGNADGHAKNLSVLHGDNGSVRLAPFYDLVSTAAYPTIATRLAMKVGAQSDPGHIRGRDWRRLADDIEVRAAFVLDVVRDLAESLPTRAKKVATEMQERYGDLAAIEMILPKLRSRARRTLQLLKE